jgi:hypothetical protein
MSDRMKPADVDPAAVTVALAELKKRTFRTKDLADMPSMRRAHALWAGQHGSGYYPSVGSYLSMHSEELGIQRISPDTARNAMWKKAPAPVVGAEVPALPEGD